MNRKKDKLICGWGINDVNYHIYKYSTVEGKRKIIWSCPYYKDWTEMVRRCYDKRLQERCPTYIGCTICDNWKYLSNFIKWVDSQPNKDWINCSLDKDFLKSGSKHYGVETVVYIPHKLNTFILDCTANRGKYLVGVSLSKSSKNRYTSSCNNPFTNKQEYLGLFHTELEAHKAWQAKKHEHACMLADLQDDERVAKSLRDRYAPDKDCTTI